ncbi:MAG TPA: HAMP domain-containing sensor histidine kinase [bacterium]|nr:HAMP domain-containing sensor histidine kinase [bacterium]
MAGRFSVTPALIRSSLFVGMIALSGASLLFSSRLARSLEHRTATFTNLFARFAAGATMAASQDEEAQRLFRRFLDNVTFPIILTDRRGVPWTAKGTGVSVDDLYYDEFATTDPANPPPGPISTLIRQAYEMDLERTPIPMINSETGEIWGYIHYGESSLVKQLRLMPVFQILVAGVLVAFGYFGIRSVRESERRSIWVGMAKETAHQLGTPISSMMGWVDLLDASAPSGDTETRGTLQEMRTDLARLTQVARRFERIGSAPMLERLDVNEVVEEVAVYLRRRLPTRSRKVEIVTKLGDLTEVRGDRELISWTVENLVKNSIDAILRSETGQMVLVSTAPAPSGGVRIHFEDDGPGIPEPVQGRIFEPGFTTKKRGWGLGLALARRIVEEYHGGRIRLLRSTPGVRTVFAVTLPAGAERE